MNFEEIFKVPNGNTLSKVSFRKKGTMDQNEYWKHEELDPDGNVIAKFESWSCTSLKPPCKTSSGYKKFDLKGNLIDEGDI